MSSTTLPSMFFSFSEGINLFDLFYMEKRLKRNYETNKRNDKKTTKWRSKKKKIPGDKKL